MKQLRPSTILAIGIPVSFLVNVFSAWLTFLLVPAEAQVGSLGEMVVVLAGATTVLISVPVFVLMALVQLAFKPKVSAVEQTADGEMPG